MAPVATDKTLDMDLLKRRDPILFYKEVSLYVSPWESGLSKVTRVSWFYSSSPSPPTHTHPRRRTSSQVFRFLDPFLCWTAPRAPSH